MVHVSRVGFLTDVAALRRADRIQPIQIQVSGDPVLQSVVTPLVTHRNERTRSTLRGSIRSF